MFELFNKVFLLEGLKEISKTSIEESEIFWCTKQVRLLVDVGIDH